MKGNKALIGLLALLVLVIVLSGCLKEIQFVKAKEIQRFQSYDALVAAFKEAGAGRQGGIFETALSVTTAGMPLGAVPSVGKAGAEAAEGVSYSRTNVQVEGVDEADIVKTDGKFIYNFSQNKLAITDAYPIETSGIVSMTDLNASAPEGTEGQVSVMPQEMFVLNDRLLLFGNKGYYGPVYETGVKAMPYYYGGYGGGIVVQLYDVADRSKPVLLKELEFEGSYLTSRLIGSNAYFVVNSWPTYADENNIIPLMVEDGVEKKVAEATDIGYLPPMPVESFVTIVSLNLDSMDLAKETIAGNAENVFASLDNIYLASIVWSAPEIPLIAGAGRIIVGDTIENTVVNKFNLSEGKISFVGQGSVPGHVLNQFSMDEFEETFRIATTAGQVSRSGSQTSNNVYVLDKEMKLAGKLEDLAPGEKIYSARFMGKRAYLVTFKKVDPLFVIDLSNPAEPKVLGKLKIPGFSDYLHPIDENHLIGVGKETIEAKGGEFAWYQGMKLAVFDVGNVEAPIELHKVVIGDRGTDSYALSDHKAFLYDREKELLVLPIMLAEIPEAEKQKQAVTGSEGEIIEWPAYGEPVFQGAFVYKLTLENGFEEKGRITHVSKEDELKRGYYFGDEYSVKRALFIDGVLYTLSDSMLKANSLADLSELKEFVFPKTEPEQQGGMTESLPV